MEPTQSEIRRRVEDFLASLRVFTLATSSDNMPWACPLAFAYDRDLNFYCITKGHSRHVRNIESNSAVAMAMHEHQSPTYNPKRAKGLQLEGTAEILRGKDMLIGMKVFIARFPLAEAMSRERLLELKTARVIRIRPKRAFFLDRENIGERVELEMI